MKIRQILPLALALLMVSCGTSRVATKSNATSIVGSEWVVDELNDSRVDGEPESFSLRFGDDYKISGVGACNRLMGSYTLTNNGSLKIENLATTLMYCPNIELEDEYVDALEVVTNYSVDGNILSLYNKKEIIITLKRVQ